MEQSKKCLACENDNLQIFSSDMWRVYFCEKCKKAKFYMFILEDEINNEDEIKNILMSVSDKQDEW